MNAGWAAHLGVVGDVWSGYLIGIAEFVDGYSAVDYDYVSVEAEPYIWFSLRGGIVVVIISIVIVIGMLELMMWFGMI